MTIRYARRAIGLVLVSLLAATPPASADPDDAARVCFCCTPELDSNGNPLPPSGVDSDGNPSTAMIQWGLSGELTYQIQPGDTCLNIMSALRNMLIKRTANLKSPRTGKLTAAQVGPVVPDPTRAGRQLFYVYAPSPTISSAFNGHTARSNDTGVGGSVLTTGGKGVTHKSYGSRSGTKRVFFGAVPPDLNITEAGKIVIEVALIVAGVETTRTIILPVSPGDTGNDINLALIGLLLLENLDAEITRTKVGGKIKEVIKVSPDPADPDDPEVIGVGIETDTPEISDLSVGVLADEAPGACCLKDGTCVEVPDEPTCNCSLGGIFNGVASTCCATECAPPCDPGTNVNPPAATTDPSAPDDDCSNYTIVTPCPDAPTTDTGDLFNSGCDAPDANQSAYWSLAPGALDRLWCASTGSYVLDQTGQGGTREFLNEMDYYELDLSTEPDDTQLTITITSQAPLNVYVVPGRARTDCPTLALDGTDDVRLLPETISLFFRAGLPVTITLCLAPDQHILLIESASAIDCGHSYQAQLDFEPDCEGACCIPGGACVNVPEDSTNTAQGQASCDALAGVYRGLGSRCPGTGGTNPLHFVYEISCCSVVCEQGDILDSDFPTEGGPGCAAITADASLDTNGSCVQGAAAASQSLGTLDPLGNGGGPDGSITVSVCGSVGRAAAADLDVYTFDIPPGPDAELLFSWDAEFHAAVTLYTAAQLDPAGACDLAAPGRRILIDRSPPCAPTPRLVALSGAADDGAGNVVLDCLPAGQTYYLFVQLHPDDAPQCDASYRFSLELYECRQGACCIDNAGCIGQLGFLQCELGFAGTFVENALCPTKELSGNLCRGVCCLDQTCTTDTTFRDCCLQNGALPQTDPDAPGFAVGSFPGYSVGDSPADCSSPNTCFPSGACCYDTPTGYDCVDDRTSSQCIINFQGMYMGDDTVCADDPCADLAGACCLGPNCAPDQSPLSCQSLAGLFLGAGTDCSADPCLPAGGACCFACPDGDTCVDAQTFDDCKNALQGLYAGDGSSCASAVCDTLCRADLDGDGDVDIFDFGIFGPNFGTGTTRCEGDFNCDGIVDVFDFGFFGPNFGCTGPAANTCP